MSGIGDGSSSPLLPEAETRRRLALQTLERLERFWERGADLPLAAPQDAATLRQSLAAFDFASARPAAEVLAEAVDFLEAGMVHSASPRYFGLFNPTPSYLGTLADWITATLNPQLAAWSHAPAASEIERHLISYFGTLLGLPAGAVAGHFTSGGAEANLTGLLLALTRASPEFASGGARALPGPPRFYASAESHLAWLKIAHQCGLGRDAVRLVGTDGTGRMSVERLRAALAEDRAAGAFPFLIVATAGTTNAGMIDPLPALADLAEEEALHLHVDAAWGGAAILSERLGPSLEGIGRADSITLDAHKWLSAPMGAGMLLCRDAQGGEGLHQTFRVSTSYMPAASDGRDPYTHSAQWSRRFIGLKLFLTLAALGRAGFAEVLEGQARLADHLRRELEREGWKVVNDTPLPLVCFVDARAEAEGKAETPTDLQAIADRLAAHREGWISPTRLEGKPVLRACITSYRSTEADIEALVRGLGEARGVS